MVTSKLVFSNVIMKLFTLPKAQFIHSSLKKKKKKKLLIELD
jgi:hypothetical protein